MEAFLDDVLCEALGINKSWWMVMANMEESKVLLATCLRNGSKRLRALKKLLSSLSKLCKTCKILIVESDSTDDSVEKLSKWACQDSRVVVRCLGKLDGVYPLRTERLAHCRNVYLHYAQEYFSSPENGYLIVFDSDGCLSGEFIRDAGKELAACLERSQLRSWFGVSGTTRPIYYDVWALRAKGWSDNDCWQDCDRLKGLGMSAALAERLAVKAKQITLHGMTEWIPVASAFNGLAMYRAGCIKGCRYIGTDADGRPACEHVSFHESLVRNNPGLMMFIDPMLVTGLTPLEHFKSPPFELVKYSVAAYIRYRVNRTVNR